MMGRLWCKLGLHLPVMVSLSDNLQFVRVACVRPECTATWVYNTETENSRQV